MMSTSMDFAHHRAFDQNRVPAAGHVRVGAPSLSTGPGSTPLALTDRDSHEGKH